MHFCGRKGYRLEAVKNRDKIERHGCLFIDRGRSDRRKHVETVGAVLYMEFHG